MSFRYRRDKPLPKGLVYGITSIMFESALEPAKPPEKSNADHASPMSTNHKDEKEKQEAE